MTIDASSGAAMNQNRRRHEQQIVVSQTLQRLFGACKNVFEGPGSVPSPEQVQILRRFLDDMKPEDVGLSRDLQFFRPKNQCEGTQRVTSSTIYKCKNFENALNAPRDHEPQSLNGESWTVTFAAKVQVLNAVEILESGATILEAEIIEANSTRGRNSLAY